MPVLHSNFSVKFPFSNRHVSTVYRTLFSNPSAIFTRKRLDTPDGDFLDLDISSVKSDHLVLMIHGLEGSSNSKYILSTTSVLNKNKFDVIVLNLRGCSGELNRLFKAYHSGETGDLHHVIAFIGSHFNYKTISLVGFSLGGNVVLKYAGEQQMHLTGKIASVVAVCPPCDLKGSSEVLAKKSNRIYMKRFLNTLVSKALTKSKMFPEKAVQTDQLIKAKNFKDFDALYTAPAFGFKDAEDYWEKASSKPYLKSIQVPTYILSAANDPFLSESCFPISIAEKHAFLSLEIPKYGGHIGFINSWSPNKNTWCEEKITKFITENLSKQ